MRGAAAVFDEKYDLAISLRMPKALGRRIKEIKKAWKARSLNTARVKLLRLGAQVYEWAEKNKGRLDPLREADGLASDAAFEVVVKRLLELGLEAWGRERARR